MNPREAAEKVTGDVFWQASRAVRHEIVDPDQNLTEAKTHLETGSLIIIVNHFDKYNMVVIGHVIENHLATLRHVSAITSLKHSDPTRHKLDPEKASAIEYTLIDLGRKSRGFGVLRVVQDYDREFYEKHPQALSGKSIDGFNMDSLRDAAGLLRTPGEILIIAPEGTRNPNGELSEAKKGVETLLRLARKTALVLPVGLIPPKDVKTHPIITRIRVVIGKPFSYDALQEEHSQNPALEEKDLIMNHLARLLPSGYQGRYGNANR